jgi:hypothetical protein
MAGEAEYGSLPFQEAIDFFREKINIPTKKWNDLWQGEHARGFMVAGASKTELLADFRSAVDKAIAEGTTLEDFRKDFDTIVEKHGWSYNGSRNWRSEVIYSTNIGTAYDAGRYKQMTDPDVLAYRPNWQYKHGGSLTPRLLHLSWDNLILPWNDPWWKDHYPRKGWGCKCRVFPMSDRDMKKAGKETTDTAPNDGTYQYVDKYGEIQEIPKGVDPGWNYNVGEAAWGKPIAAEAMTAWQKEGAKAFEPLTPGNWETAGRPKEIPLDAPIAKPGAPLATQGLRAEAIREMIGGEQKVYSFQAGDFRYDILVAADPLATHITPDKTPYLPLLNEAMADPYEVWLRFERHKGTGQVVLRARIIKAIDLGKGKGVMMVANASKGLMEGWTFFSPRNLAYLEQQRAGKLIWARK